MKKQIIKIIILIFTIILFQSCENNTTIDPKIKNDITMNPPIDNHLKFFGFTLVDVGWDDTLDKTIKTNYVDEVAPFSNVADINLVDPNENIISRLQFMEQHKMKAMLHVYELFFEQVGINSVGGTIYDLRPDYKTRWDNFVKINDIYSNSSLIQTFYVGEEPFMNDISFLELKTATDYIKSTVPEVPIMIIEAYTFINKLQIPTTVDWVGFDHYFVNDPLNSKVYRNELELVKSKLSTPTQKIVLILDAHYREGYHDFDGSADGHEGTISEEEMIGVATSYYNLAQEEPDVIALLGYFWPGGFDQGAKGARQLPQSVIDQYIKIGKIITGK